VIDYKQPDFYRFNEDSIELVNWLKQHVGQVSSLLDLGSGCGVIGLELARYYNPGKLLLLEGQTAFLDSLEFNKENFYPSAQIVISTFSKWIPEDKFDLIVCNPPYFSAGKGRSSPDPRRAMAREFVNDGWAELWKVVINAIDSNGRVAMVLRQDTEVELPSNMTFIKFELRNLLILFGHVK